jgi:hypothetical protein
VRRGSSPNAGVVDWLLSCPEKGFFVPIESESTDSLCSLIAATALAHRLAVATRNVADFEKAGCAVVNPFEG